MRRSNHLNSDSHPLHSQFDDCRVAHFISPFSPVWRRLSSWGSTTDIIQIRKHVTRFFSKFDMHHDISYSHILYQSILWFMLLIQLYYCSFIREIYTSAVRDLTLCRDTTKWSRNRHTPARIANSTWFQTHNASLRSECSFDGAISQRFQLLICWLSIAASRRWNNWLLVITEDLADLHQFSIAVWRIVWLSCEIGDWVANMLFQEQSAMLHCFACQTTPRLF
jgi:hypothetical protein